MSRIATAARLASRHRAAEILTLLRIPELLAPAAADDCSDNLRQRAAIALR